MYKPVFLLSLLLPIVTAYLPLTPEVCATLTAPPSAVEDSLNEKEMCSLCGKCVMLQRPSSKYPALHFIRNQQLFNIFIILSSLDIMTKNAQLWSWHDHYDSLCTGVPRHAQNWVSQRVTILC